MRLSTVQEYTLAIYAPLSLDEWTKSPDIITAICGVSADSRTTFDDQQSPLEHNLLRFTVLKTRQMVPYCKMNFSSDSTSFDASPHIDLNYT
uniref:Uncharacterized protein n=1 Tax=Pristionchus pacificus TaxID=54126 RepID=A0A2A6CM84_PRIPA|eukprot:PDM79163.1 hypothetical protein PRIPAC_31742 [Pristionchus pacificus]